MIKGIYRLGTEGRLRLVFLAAIFIVAMSIAQGYPNDSWLIYLAPVTVFLLYPELLSVIANRFLAGGYLRSALRICDEGLALCPRSMRLSLVRAITLARMKRLNDAEQELSKTLEYAPGSSQVLIARSRVRIHLTKLEDAENDASQAIAIVPNRREFYQNRAVARLGLQNYEGALADCLQIQKFGRLSSAVKYLMGVAYVRLGRMDDAETLLNSFIGGIQDGSFEALSLAHWHYLHGEFAAALELCSQVNSKQELATSFLSLQAFAYWRLNEGREALSVLDTLAVADPERMTHHPIRAYVFAEAGRFEEALQECLALAQLNIDRSSTLDAAAYVFWRQGDWSGMQKASQDAVSACDSSAFSQAMLSLSLTGLGRLEEARTCALQAIKLDKLDAWCWYSLANVQLKSGQATDSLESLNTGLVKDSNHRLSYELRAEGYRLLGDNEKAAADQARYEELQARLIAGVAASSQHT